MRATYLILFIAPVLLCFTVSGKSSLNKHQKKRICVFDRASLLTSLQEDSISYIINKLENEIGSQVAVITIKSLEGKKIEQFSLEEAEALQLGRSTHNDGLLITVAVQERTIRIEVGTGLENIIRDEVASRIVRNTIVPKFREFKYGLGIYAGIDSISNRIIKNKQIVGQEPRW